MKQNIIKIISLAMVSMMLFGSCSDKTPATAGGECSSEDLTAGSASTASVDTISSASTNFYYADSALTQAEFIADLSAEGSNRGSSTVATVNPDGSPNLAVVIPGVVDDNTLVFGVAPNQTSENFKAQKMAVLSYYIYNPTATEKTERNVGCRVILELIVDEARIAELNEGKSDTDSIYYFNIVKVIPLG